MGSFLDETIPFKYSFNNINNHESQMLPVEDFVPENFSLRRCTRYVKVDLAIEKQKCGRLEEKDCVCGQDIEWHRRSNIHVDENAPPAVLDIHAIRRQALSASISAPPQDMPDKGSDKAPEAVRTVQELQRPWSVQLDTELYPCDTFGELIFEAGDHVDPKSIAHGATAKYIRLRGVLQDEDPIYKDRLYELMTSKSYWNMPRPQLIIEVTGSAQDLPHVDRQVIEAFNEGLIQAAKSANAWLVTGGTNCGVMRLVGEAVARHHMSYYSSRADHQIPCLGIASWGIVEDRNDLIRNDEKDNEEPVIYPVNQGRPGGYSPLDPGHNYFILVDNGKEKRFGEEINFRAEFTAYLTGKVLNTGGPGNATSMTPLVLLVIGGGPNTLKTIEVSVGGDQKQTSQEAIESMKRPVVVLPGFGGAADVLAYAYEISGSDDEQPSSGEPATQTGPFPEDFDEKIKNHSALKRLLGNRSKDPKTVQQTIESLKRCLQDRKLITVVDMFKKGETKASALDQAILKAIFKAKMHDPKSLLALFMLAQQWSQNEIAESILSKSYQDKHGMLKEYIEPRRCMARAIEWGQCRFFELLIDYKVVDLNSYFTRNDMLKFYSNIFITRSGMPRSCNISRTCISFFRSMLLQDTLAEELEENSMKSKKYLSKRIGRALQLLLGCDLANPFREICSQQESEAERNSAQEGGGGVCRGFGNFMTRNSTFRRLSSAFLDLSGSPPTEDDKYLRDINYPTKMRDLFIFSLLLKRTDFADVAWRDSTEHLGTALMGTILLTKLGNYAGKLDMHDLAQEYKHSAIAWQERTIAILTKCYDIKPETTFRMLTRSLSLWQGKTVMELAFNGREKNFIAHTAVQAKLKQIWYGRVASFGSPYLVCAIALIPLLWPLVVYIQFVPEPTDLSTRKKGATGHRQPVDLHVKRTEANNRFNITNTLELRNIRDVEPGTEDRPDRPVPKEYDEDEGASRDSLRHEPTLLEPVLFYHFRKKHQSPNAITIWQALKFVYKAPMVKFLFHSLATLCFLLLFTFFILTSFAMPIGIIEVIIWIWSFSFFLEELLSHFHRGASTFQKMTSSFLSDSSGLITLAAETLMILAIFLRVCLPLELYVHPHTVYALSCLIFWINSLQIFYVIEVLGPKVVILVKMFYELVFFLVIYIILLFAFSVAIHALLHPAENITDVGDFFSFLLHVVYVRWWNLAGVGLDDGREEVEHHFNYTTFSGNNNGEGNETMSNGEEDSDGKTYHVVAVLLLIVYVFLTNIMLLNMLIAMLSMKVEEVQQDSFRIWRFSYYRVAMNYYNKLLVPPPFNIVRLLYEFVRAFILKRKRSTNGRTDSEIKVYIDPNGPEYAKLNIIEQSIMGKVVAEEQEKARSGDD